MKKKVLDLVGSKYYEEISRVINGLKFTKNFRSSTAEEWYVVLPGYEDPKTGGAPGKVIIHYDLQGNKEIFINTTLILDDPKLHDPEQHNLVYGIGDEIVNRLVGYADTLLSVHAGENSFSAEYVD